MKDLFLPTHFANRAFVEFIPEEMAQNPRRAIFELAKTTTFAKDIKTVDLGSFLLGLSTYIEQSKEEDAEKLLEKKFAEFFKLGLPNANPKEIKVLQKAFCNFACSYSEESFLEKTKNFLSYCKKSTALAHSAVIYERLLKSSEKSILPLKNFVYLACLCDFINQLLNNNELAKQFIVIDYFGGNIVVPEELHLDIDTLSCYQDDLFREVSKLFIYIPFSMASLDEWKTFSFSYKELFDSLPSDQLKQLLVNHLKEEELDLEKDVANYGYEILLKHTADIIKAQETLSLLKNLKAFSFETLCLLAEKHYLNNFFTHSNSLLNSLDDSQHWISAIFSKKETQDGFCSAIKNVKTSDLIDMGKKLNQSLNSIKNSSSYNSGKASDLRSLASNLLEVFFQPFYLCTASALLSKENGLKNEILYNLARNLTKGASQRAEKYNPSHILTQERDIIENTLALFQEHKHLIADDFIERNLSLLFPAKGKLFVLSPNFFIVALGLISLSKNKTETEILGGNQQLIEVFINSITQYHRNALQNLSSNTKQLAVNEMFSFLTTSDFRITSSLLKGLCETAIGDILSNEQFLILFQKSITQTEDYFEYKDKWLFEKNLEILSARFCPIGKILKQQYENDLAKNFRATRDIVLKMDAYSQLLLLAIENTTNACESKEVVTLISQLILINERANLFR